MSLTPPEQDKANWSSPSGSLVYVGSSMYPAFKAPEIIYFVPYADREVRRGDVVIFNKPGEEGISITHRVVAVTADGIKTQGDNNLRADPWTLEKGDIIGHVIYARRDRRCRRIRGGLHGIIDVSIRRTNRRMARTILGMSSAICRKALRALIGEESRGRPR